MLISLCIPVHNRTKDLKSTLPITIAAANASPPVEIAILDYCSPDDIREYMRKAIGYFDLANGVSLTYHRYEGNHYYHKAHAFNLAVLRSEGEYCVIMGADAYPDIKYIECLRSFISDGCIWMRSSELHGIVCFERQEFIDAGGYDERFEFYGPEDRDLDNRFARRGGKFGLLPKGLMHVIKTEDSEKVKNFRLKGLSKHQMSKLMRPIFDENERNGVTVVNQGKEWGKWE